LLFFSNSYSASVCNRANANGTTGCPGTSLASFSSLNSAANDCNARNSSCVAQGGTASYCIWNSGTGSFQVRGGCSIPTPPQGTTNPSSTFCFASEANAQAKLEGLKNNCFEYSGASFIGTLERYNDAGNQAVGGYWYCVTNAYCSRCASLIVSENILGQAISFCCVSGIKKEPKVPVSGVCSEFQGVIGIGYKETEIFGNQSNLCSSAPADYVHGYCRQGSLQICYNAENLDACLCDNSPDPELCRDDVGGSSASPASSSSGSGDGGDGSSSDSSVSFCSNPFNYNDPYCVCQREGFGSPLCNYTNVCRDNASDLVSFLAQLILECQSSGGSNGYSIKPAASGGQYCISGTCNDGSSSGSGGLNSP